MLSTLKDKQEELFLFSPEFSAKRYSGAVEKQADFGRQMPALRLTRGEWAGLPVARSTLGNCIMFQRGGPEPG
jgi:hypothetical protein